MAKKTNETQTANVEAVQTETKATKKAPAKKAAAKETTTKKAATKETAAKKPATKKATVKAEKVVETYVEFAGNQVLLSSVEDRVKAAYVAEGHRESSIKTLKVYVKPEENAAYYVINEDNVGRVDLFA